MTWAPCPHGVRTRGKKDSNSLFTFFCTSGGAVCAGYAQVTLVEPRVSYRSGCDTRGKRTERQTKTQTKNTPAKNKRNL